jgi:hypothetical protein
MFRLEDRRCEIERLFRGFQRVGIGGEKGSAFGGGGGQWHEDLMLSGALENKKPPG